MAKEIKVALVGCGKMGRAHLEVLQSLPAFAVVALCDIVSPVLTYMSEQYGIKGRYVAYEQMYDAAKPDVVVVATQTRDHCQPTVAALQRGMAVLCEKPIAIDLAEADQMVAAAKATGAKLVINHQTRVSPGMRKIQDLVRQGAIGEVVLVRGRNKGGRKSGNECMEMGTHVTDMMLGVGGMPQWCAGTVYCQRRLARLHDIMEAKEMAPHERDSGLVMGEWAVAHYGFTHGILGELHFLGYARSMISNYGVDILGTEGQLALRAAAHGSNVWYLPRPMEGRPADASDWRMIELGEVSRQQVIATMYHHFIETMEQGIEPPMSGEEGRWAFEMIMAIYQSHREGGRRVELPLRERRHPLAVWRETSRESEDSLGTRIGDLPR
jgi:predicted dehydrogenase